MKYLAVILMCGVAMGQTAKDGNITANTLTLDTSGYTVQDTKGVIITCKTEVPSECSLAKGRTLDDLMGAFVYMVRDSNKSWKEENQRIQDRLNIALGLLRAQNQHKPTKGTK